MEDNLKETSIRASDGNNSEEISLIDLLAVLLKYKKLIIIVPLLAAIMIVALAVVSIKLAPEKSFLPNVYTPKAHMLINDEKAGGGMSSMLAGLAGLAGISGSSGGGGSSMSSLAQYLAESNPLLDAIVDNFAILEKPIFEKSRFPKSESRDYIKRKLSVSLDDETGVFTISFTDIDPVFAQGVVNFAVDWLQERFDALGVDKNKITKENLEKNIALSFEEIQNLQKQANKIANSVNYGNGAWSLPSISVSSSKVQMELDAQREVYKQLKTQYELLKVKMQSESPVFQILERPEVPDRKSGPSRGKLCVIVTFAAIFLSVFLAFSLNAVKNIKNDPEAMKKLHG